MDASPIWQYLTQFLNTHNQPMLGTMTTALKLVTSRKFWIVLLQKELHLQTPHFFLQVLDPTKANQKNQPNIPLGFPPK